MSGWAPEPSAGASTSAAAAILLLHCHAACSSPAASAAPRRDCRPAPAPPPSRLPTDLLTVPLPPVRTTPAICCRRSTFICSQRRRRAGGETPSGRAHQLPGAPAGAPWRPPAIPHQLPHPPGERGRRQPTACRHQHAMSPPALTLAGVCQAPLTTEKRKEAGGPQGEEGADYPGLLPARCRDLRAFSPWPHPLDPKTACKVPPIAPHLGSTLAGSASPRCKS